MAGKRLPNCLKKRNLLNSNKADRSELIRLGEQYLQEEQLSDTIDFYQKAEYQEGLSQLKERAILDGDYFLYHRLVKALQDTPEREEWLRLGDNAFNQGKLQFARSAYRQADQSEKLARVEALINAPPEEREPDKSTLQ
jgi:hypothetical protein